MLTEVIFPTGLRMALSYQSSGELSQVVSPTCGVSRFYYGSYPVYNRLLGQSVTDHRISNYDKGDSNVWNWNYYGSGAAPSLTTTNVAVPGPWTVVSHYMEQSSPGWGEGFLTKTIVSGTPNTESRQGWTQDDIQSASIANPRVAYKEAVLNGSSSQTARTEFTYAANTDYSGNTKEIREFSFSGTLRGKTELSYLHESNPSYSPLNILDRVIATIVRNGSNGIVAKTTVAYDQTVPLSSTPNAIRHDPAFGPYYAYRGLPTTTSNWYDIGNNLYITTSVQYDECGNPTIMMDPKGSATTLTYWLSSADNAYAFPLRTVNPKMQAAQATYSYDTGVMLSNIDANGKQTTFEYGSTRDRLTRINKPSGGARTYTYADSCDCSATPNVTPYAEIRDYVSGQPGDPSAKFKTIRTDLDIQGRPVENTATDPNGNIKTHKEFGEWGQVSSFSVPYRETAALHTVSYTHNALTRIGSISLPVDDTIYQGTVSYAYDTNQTTITNSDGRRRKYTYQEDGKISHVFEEDENGNLTVQTDYAYDTLARLTTIIQGVQTRTFSYDALGRLISETHPESGTTSFTYDLNSNIQTKTDARGITTTISYDELNRPTLKSHSDGTPFVEYFYDSQPADSPIAIANPIGRLTRISTTTSGVVSKNFFSYCDCSSVYQEATVIVDGMTKTYITTYTHDYLGGITSMVYPNGQIVSYTTDSIGRPSKVTSTLTGLSIDYVYSTSYLGPSGQLTDIAYVNPTLRDLFTFSPATGRLTSLRTLGVAENYQYGDNYNGLPRNGLIYDIIDVNNASNSKHYNYDKRYQLTSYWTSADRNGTPDRQIGWTHDQYGNILTMLDNSVLTTYSVDSASNRLLSTTNIYGTTYHSYDNAGNDLSDGKTYDAENRVTYAAPMSYLYDGNSRRLRSFDGVTKTYFIYSATGLLLDEDNWTTSVDTNQIYFNGKLVATHDDNDYVLMYFRDYLGSVRTVINVTRWYYGFTWQIVAATDYLPYGYQQQSFMSPYSYTGMRRDSSSLRYCGARYLESGNSYKPTLRWVSADPIMARPYDPLSLNKYSYVRNDPVNLIDPDGKFARGFISDRYWEYLYFFEDPPFSSRPTKAGDSRGGGVMSFAATSLTEEQIKILIKDATKRAFELFDNKKECAELFSSNVNFRAMLDMMSKGTWGSIKTAKLDPDVSANTQPVFQDVLINGVLAHTNNIVAADIKVNLNGPIQNGYSTSPSLNGSPRFGLSIVDNLAITLIHEMGHAVWFIYGKGSSSIIPDDLGSDKEARRISALNSETVYKSCF